MGIFDIDSGTDNHLLNEQFHVFSKSPASVATALGDASNRSGHTVTASDVWGQEIPAFFYAKTQAVAQTYKSLAKTNDLCRIGNSVAIFENGDWVVKYNSYTDIPDGHKFKNAAGDDVIRFHKNRLAYNLNLDNNAADDGLNTTAKIQGWDEENGKVYDYVATAPKFVTQFVTSTDKIVDGIPSKGFGPFVMAGTTTGDITKVLPEGTSDQNHYIANSFAGIIQFNKARTDEIYVHAFEYCGKTLKSAYSDIVELEDKLSKISVTASGGVQDASTDAKTAGFSVTTETRTNSEDEEETIPVFDIETGSVTTGETKLVTGGVVKTYVDSTALAEGGSIAEYIKTYVSQNAKVSVNGQSATTITVEGTEESSSDIVHIIVTEDKTTTDKIGLTLTATIDEAVLNEDGSIKEDGVVIATIAQDIAEKTIKDAIETDNGAIKNAIKDATLNSGTQGDNQIQNATGDTANKLVTAAQVKEYVTENAQVTVTDGTTDVTATGFEFTGSTGTDVSVSAELEEVTGADGKKSGKVTYSATLSKATVDATTGAITNDSGSLAVSASDAKTIADKAIANSLTGSTDGTIGKAIADAQTAADGKVADVTVDDISIVSGDAGSKVAALTTTKVAAITPSVDSASTALATEASVAKALASITSVGVSYQVLADDQKHESITAPVNGRIYLEKDSTNADAGVYIEWMFTNESGWEKIGSTKTDHSSYASTITVNGSPENVTDSAVDLGALVSSVADGTVTGTVSASGELALTVDTEALVENGAIKASVTDANALITAADALAAIKLAKPENYVASVTGYTTAGKEVTTQGEVAVKVLDGRGTTVTASDLWGTTATMDASGVITVDHKYVSNPNASSYNAWNSSITKVEDNKAYVNDTLQGNIQTDMIKDGSYMFRFCSQLTSFDSDLSSLTNGEMMFDGCTNLESFNTDLPSLTSGIQMFQSCPKLTSFDSDLSSLTNGYGMFLNCSELPSFNSDLSSLMDGSYMFAHCYLLESFNCDLSSLTNGEGMFQHCEALPSFNFDLSSLTNGEKMFADCPKLESFNGDLSSLTNGNSMFIGCTVLTTFVGDLSSLTNGVDMFRYCTLDAESLEIISENLPTVTSGTIDIGASTNATEEVIATIKGKGWTLKSNGTTL